MHARLLLLFGLISGPPAQASYLQTSPNVKDDHIALGLFGGVFPNSNDGMGYASIGYGWTDRSELQALVGLGSLDFLAGGFLKYYLSPELWAPISVQVGLIYWNERGYLSAAFATSHDFGFIEPYLALPARIQFSPGQIWLEVVPGVAFPLTQKSILQLEATLPVLNSLVQISAGVRWYL